MKYKSFDRIEIVYLLGELRAGVPTVSLVDMVPLTASEIPE